MAARRISKSTVDWAKFLERVPENQKAQFMAFKGKSEGYLRTVFAYPENPQPIDFSAYKQRLPNPKMAEEFEAKLKALQIPYPKDNVTSQIEAQAKEGEAAMAAFKAESAKRISEYQRQIAEMEKQIPVEHMTVEDYMHAFPETAWNPAKPTYYPHTAEIQEEIEQGKHEQAHH